MFKVPMKLPPQLTIPLSIFVGAAGGALANSPTTAFLSVASAEHVIIGAAVVGLVAVSHWLMDPRPPQMPPAPPPPPQPVTVNVQTAPAQPPTVLP